MKQPRRWDEAKVAELRRRRAEGVTLQALADEAGVSRQAIWTMLNWDTEKVRRMLYQKQTRAARKAAKLADIEG